VRGEIDISNTADQTDLHRARIAIQHGQIEAALYCAMTNICINTIAGGTQIGAIVPIPAIQMQKRSISCKAVIGNGNGNGIHCARFSQVPM